MKKLLQIAGVRVIAYIEDNIKKGIDYEGKQFQYSTKPFFRPYHPKIYSKLGGKKNAGKLFQIVTSKSTGKLGFIITGGYKEYKQKVHPSAYGNFLTVSGKMLRAMNLNVTANEAIIKFTGEDEQKKAYWLNISGAGKSRKLWKFLGIMERQKKELAQTLEGEYKNIVVKELGRIIANKA